MKNLSIVTILLFCAFLVGIGCEKSNSTTNGTTNSTFPGNYISKMGDIRAWHGIDTGVMSSRDTPLIFTPFSYTLHDTFGFQVTGLNVSIGYFGYFDNVGGHFTFQLADTAEKYLSFSSDPGSQLRYYYAADSMVMTGGYDGIHGSESVYLRTP